MGIIAAKGTFMIDLLSYPVLGICGWSNSGKTTVIEKVLLDLAEQALSVVVVKRDVHGINLDVEGKDSDRFFQAGADVLIQGPKQSFIRSHFQNNGELALSIPELTVHYDFILFEGHKDIPVPKVWLQSPDETGPPEGIQNCLAVLGRDEDRLSTIKELIQQRLFESQIRMPVYGCVLIGGQSQRMGRCKHLLPHASGGTWLDYIVGHLQQACAHVVIVGRGDIPGSLASVSRLPDAPDAKGPLAGILAAMRWMPHSNWLVSACDLPQLSMEALNWLLALRGPGIYGALPRLKRSPGLEPLLAFYSGRCRRLIEVQVAQDDFCPLSLARHSRVITPRIPSGLAHSWHNVNSPEECPSSSSQQQ
jgi:molybdopterin-guanine dinucleotide biosynthesis protein MobB